MIGIIGVGKRMRGMLRRIRDDLGIDLPISGIYDPDRDSVSKYIEMFGNPRIYDCYEDLISDPSISWVFIGSPNKFHKEQIVSSFNNGKNVFCEKPLATSLSDLEEIKKSYDKTDVRFIISYPLIYSPHYVRIREIVQSGRIGKVVSLEFNETLSPLHGCFIMSDWRRFLGISGGHLLEKCSHDIAAINWILDSFPFRASSFGGLNFFKPENASFYNQIKCNNKLFDNLPASELNPFTTEKDIIDNQVVIIEYMNGVRATFHTNLCSAIPERRMYILGDEGTIRADVLTGKIEVGSFMTGNNEVVFDDENKGSHGGGDYYLLKELCDVIFGKSEKISANLDIAIESVKSVLLIEKSRCSNGGVMLYNDLGGV